ncbi:MAG: hypothetical protein JRF30_06320 [Deltaproteobacteria bacterium]|nr:hypothetical protein [Deltaproteobacteria bacterium]
MQEVFEEPSHERDGREEAPKGIEEQKVSDTAFDLTVSEDKLEAYICPGGPVPDEISFSDITDLVKTIYLVTAIPIVFRALLKNWTSGRSGL